MRKSKMLTFRVGVCAAMACTSCWAQNPTAAYPTKPVTIVLPYTPGALADLETRLYIPSLTEALGHPVIVDYKPGAGTSIGTIHVAKAAPDGYTILRASAGFTMYPAFFPADKLPYDPIKNFAPVSMIAKVSAFLVVHPSLGVKTFPEYLAYAKANPEKINFGTVGGGSNYHIAGAWLHSATNTKVTFVHYKGVGPMQTDLLAGRVTAAPGVPFNIASHVKSGKLIALANMGAERSGYFPDIKTIVEYGVKEYDYVSWSGYLVPARTPEAIVTRLSAAFAKVAKSPDVIKKMASDGAEMVGSTPEQFHQTLLTETIRWRKIVQQNDMKMEE